MPCHVSSRLSLPCLNLEAPSGQWLDPLNPLHGQECVLKIGNLQSLLHHLEDTGTLGVAKTVKNLPAMQETWT